MELSIQKYQFNQDGRDYVVSTGIINGRIRITCQENLALDGPFYSNEFTLDDLRASNQFFMLTQSPEEALIEINKGIERQKSALQKAAGDTMNFIGYLVIGTDNDIYTLPLRRDHETNKYGIFTPPSSGAADITLPTNYQVDGDRITGLEVQSAELNKLQTSFEAELGMIVQEINYLRKVSLDLKEENALVRERLKILQEKLEERKVVVMNLKNENDRIKTENASLMNWIKTQEAAIRERQQMQTNIRVKSRPNLSQGRTAVTSKFEQTAMRTFLPRTAAKQVTEEYTENNNNIGIQQGMIIREMPIVQPAIITQEIPQPIITQNAPQPVITQVQQPIITQVQQPVITQQRIITQVQQPIITQNVQQGINYQSGVGPYYHEKVLPAIVQPEIRRPTIHENVNGVVYSPTGQNVYYSSK